MNAPPPLELYLPWQWRVHIGIQLLQTTLAVLNLALIPCTQYNVIPPLLAALVSLVLSVSPRVETLLTRVLVIQGLGLLAYCGYLVLFTLGSCGAGADEEDPMFMGLSWSFFGVIFLGYFWVLVVAGPRVRRLVTQAEERQRGEEVQPV